MVGVAQLVRAPDCGSGCRGFESLYPPHKSQRPDKSPVSVYNRIDIDGGM